MPEVCIRSLAIEKFFLIAAATAVCLGWVTPAVAQEQSPKFEITPYAAYRMGGSFDEKDGAGRVEINDSSAQGVMFNVAANPAQSDAIHRVLGAPSWAASGNASRPLRTNSESVT